MSAKFPRGGAGPFLARSLLIVHVWLLPFSMVPSFVVLLVHVWLLPFGMRTCFVVLSVCVLLLTLAVCLVLWCC